MIAKLHVLTSLRVVLHFQIKFKAVKVCVQITTRQSKIHITTITTECLPEGQHVKRQLENSRTNKFSHFTTRWRDERFFVLHCGIKYNF